MASELLERVRSPLARSAGSVTSTPASVQDIAAWPGWTGVRQEVEQVRQQLVTVQNETTGRELFDTPGAPRPADVPAPARFLPEHDNVRLAHAHRSRIIQLQVPPSLLQQGVGVRFFLVDG